MAANPSFEQISLFESTDCFTGTDFSAEELYRTTAEQLRETEKENNIIYLYGMQSNRPNNSVYGERKEVFPLKRKEDIEAMASWLYNNKEPKYFLAFTLGINLGLRVNELLSLKGSDVLTSTGKVKYIEDIHDTTDEMRVYQSKTSKHRSCYLNKVCVEAIEWYRENVHRFKSKEFLFPSRKGGHITGDMFRKVLKEAAQACGIEVNIGTHTMRKTWGYWVQTTVKGDNSHSLMVLQRLFGHSSSLTTLRYVGILDEEFKSVYHSMNLDTMVCIR